MQVKVILQEAEQPMQIKLYFHVSLCSTKTIGCIYTQRGEQNKNQLTNIKESLQL